MSRQSTLKRNNIKQQQQQQQEQEEKEEKKTKREKLESDRYSIYQTNPNVIR
jgi:hypothetical protein